MRPNWENECVNKSALIEWLRPYLHTGEPIPADVLISDIQMMPPTLTPQNEPLTIKQLREMDGEPVWVEFEDGSGGLWGIVHITIFEQIVFANGLHCTIGERYYGKSYKAYRRPPERQEAGQ